MRNFLVIVVVVVSVEGSEVPEYTIWGARFCEGCAGMGTMLARRVLKIIFRLGISVKVPIWPRVQSHGPREGRVEIHLPHNDNDDGKDEGKQEEEDVDDACGPSPLRPSVKVFTIRASGVPGVILVVVISIPGRRFTAVFAGEKFFSPFSAVTREDRRRR